MNFNPSKTETAFVRESLNEFNRKNVGDDCFAPLNIVEYDNEGNIIGGLLGCTYWNWLYVDILRIEDNHRKKGIGSKLLSAAENEAIKRGCHHVHLDTMSWQALEFYKKHGYEVSAIFPDMPTGNKKYVLTKKLISE